MMTYAILRERGIRHLERMTGRSWTDFNTHDPGITLLEALCYALTDLFYRTDFDVADLLADGGSDPYASFHAPAELLTTRAVTLDDLRRVVLDVEGVKNAWIEPVQEFIPGRFVPLEGLYRVVVDASAEREGIHVRREVGRRLHKHRGLCEDFTDVVVLDPLKVRVDAKVEIGRVDDPAITYAQILDAIAEVISPTIPFATLAERLASGATMEEIFEGPLLEHGFITDEALENAFRREAIHSSDIVHAVMDVPGVRAVTEVIMRSGDGSDSWSLAIPPERAPRLDRVFSRITLRSGGMPVVIGAPPPAPVAPPRIKIGPRAGIENPPFRNRNIGAYHSVQHHLPDIYGIGEVGLPDSAPPERKAQARQLQAYLMLFDQLMANHLAQLAHVKDLFSLHPAKSESAKRTYFTQTVDEPTLGLSAVATATQVALAEMSEGHADYVARKHRFLNHLLARFAENLNDRYSAAADESLDPIEELLHHKQIFLAEYPRISGSRGNGFDSLGPWGTANPSGLEERVRFKLGLLGDRVEDREEMVVIEHVHTRPSQLHQFDWLVERLPALLADPYSLVLTFVIPGNRGRFAKLDEGQYPFRELVEMTLRSQTPAHLGTYVIWLDDAEWNEFQEAHTEWRRRRREHIASKLGISLGLDPRRRATILDLPLVPGYSAVTGDEPVVLNYGQFVRVQVDGTQEGGATYSLIRYSDKETISVAPIEGNGKSIILTSVPLYEDLIIRVPVERLFDDGILLDAVRTVKVRANPAVDVVVINDFLDPATTPKITVHQSQASVKYSVYARKLKDADFFPEGDSAQLSVNVPAIEGISSAETYHFVSPPKKDAWNAAEFVIMSPVIAGNGGDLHIPLLNTDGDYVAILRAHKDHGATPPEATDVQITKPLVLFARPGTAANLVLTRIDDGSIAVTGGEPGVLYYFFDPISNALLGRPAYFYRHGDTDGALNRGLDQVRLQRDFVVARGPIAENADRATTPALEPVVQLSAIPANHTVKVLAVRARTGVAWSSPKTMVIQTVP